MTAGTRIGRQRATVTVVGMTAGKTIGSLSMAGMTAGRKIGSLSMAGVSPGLGTFRRRTTMPGPSAKFFRTTLASQSMADGVAGKTRGSLGGTAGKTIGSLSMAGMTAGKTIGRWMTETAGKTIGRRRTATAGTPICRRMEDDYGQRSLQALHHATCSRSSKR
jgi:hypothetical protein